jgi:adenine-specific DNA glycosylase
MKVYDKFFAKFPDVYSLDSVRQEEIELVIRPLGFWRIRARDFKRMARHLIETHGGRVPEEMQQIEQIPGVGRYVTTSLACFCFGMRQAIVDVNVRRVAGRVFFWEKEMPPDSDLEQLMQEIMPPDNVKEFNWALLDFSAAVCARKPRCGKCFANDICQFYAHNSDRRQRAGDLS